VFNPYFLVALLFGLLAALGAADSSLARLNASLWFNGLRWLRVHFITLGVWVEIAFGILPIIATARGGSPVACNRP
jgi:hypothetical protein